MSASVNIRLQGKDYRVSCAPDERAALEDAVRFLDAKMSEIQSRTQGSGERLAVMTALNIVHELLALRGGAPVPVAPTDGLDAEAVQRRILSIEARLDAALAQQKQEDLF